MALTDVLILGGGPAGIQAALTVSRLHRTSKVFDNAVYRNNPQKLSSAAMHTVPLADGMPIYEYHRAARAEVERYGFADFVSAEIVAATREADGHFIVKDDQGHTFHGRKLIIASGSRDQIPEIPGFAELWGPAIAACPFCHGHENSNKRLLCWSPASPFHIGSFAMWSSLTDKPVHVLTNGHDITEAVKGPLDQFLARGHTLITKRVQRAEALHPGAVEPGLRVTFADGTSIEADFMALGAPTESTTKSIVDGLGVHLDPMGNIKADTMFQATNVKGCFAAGDTSVMAKAIPAAIATGTGAGAGVIHELTMEDLEITLPPMPGAPPAVDGAASQQSMAKARAV